MDYPRVGGEEPWVMSAVCRVSGLPPRGRGRVLEDVVGQRVRGITPAWAGKRTVRPRKRGATKDYPRVGGEEAFGAIDRRTKIGLPPRGRGRG